MDISVYRSSEGELETTLLRFLNESIISKNGKIKIYTAKSNFLWRNLKSYLDSVNIIYFENEVCLVFQKGEQLYFISKNKIKNKNKLITVLNSQFTQVEVVELLKSIFNINKIDANKLAFDIDRCKNTNSNEISQILSRYKNSTWENYQVKIPIRIKTIKYIFGYPPEIKSLPLICRSTIKNLTIFLNVKNEIVEVQVDSGVHPNIDEKNYYCLGENRFKRLTLQSLDDIISTIKIVNLNDCYFIPEKLKKYLDRNE